MVVRNIIVGLLVFFLGACAEQVTEEENPDCLKIFGNPPDDAGLGDAGIEITVRSQVSAAVVRDDYTSKYPGGVSVYDVFPGGFAANINSDAALEEMRCEDSRIVDIRYAEIPSG